MFFNNSRMARRMIKRSFFLSLIIVVFPSQTVFAYEVLTKSSLHEKYSSVMGSPINKDLMIYKSKGLRIYRGKYIPKIDEWCLTQLIPFKGKLIRQNITVLDVFYDTLHENRLKRMGGSYVAFVEDIVLPAMREVCGPNIDFTNRYIKITTHMIIPDKSYPDVVEDYLVFRWDLLTFKVEKSGVVYTSYEPLSSGANMHLSRDQIIALTPAFQKKAQVARMQVIRDRIAKRKARDDAARKANNGRNSCKYGCITLCNKTNKTYTIATAHMQSSTTRRNESGIARVEIEGWWELKPDQCYKPQAALYWQTYYSIAHKSPNGKWVYPQWNVDQAVLDGSKGKGMSGYRNGSMCIKKSDHFRRHLPGKIKSALKEVCPKGYLKAPINLFTEGQADYDLTYTLK